MTLGLKTQDVVAIKEYKYSVGAYSMLYLNNPPSSISNFALYPCSTFGGGIIFVLGSIRFNWESMDIIFLHLPLFEVSG